ncbi:MAG: class I SAM-dependent methyltransferase, partial [Planctomycetota bacterium]|nr:class I SAM-dependent methyltransferase [Planctomycetota bacterium]
GKAQVKKEMQACRALAGPPTDTDELLRVAREAARDRVVVKRHPHHAPLTDDVSFEVKSGRIRFDVYLCS